MKRKATNNKRRSTKRRRLPGNAATRASRTYNSHPREFKVTDTSSVGQIDANGTIIPFLASLTRGDNPLNQYEGLQIQPAGIQLRFNILQTVTATPYVSMRLMIFQWMDSTPPTVGRMLQGALGVGTSHLSVINLENRALINVLYDRVFRFNQQSSSVPYLCPNVSQKGVYIPGNKIFPVTFKVATDAPQKGGLFMLAISNNLIIGNSPSFSYYARTTYIDT